MGTFLLLLFPLLLSPTSVPLWRQGSNDVAAALLLSSRPLMIHGPQQERSSKQDDHCIQMGLLRALSCRILETTRDEDSSNCPSAWLAPGQPSVLCSLHRTAQAARPWARITMEEFVVESLIQSLLFSQESWCFRQTAIPRILARDLLELINRESWRTAYILWPDHTSLWGPWPVAPSLEYVAWTPFWNGDGQAFYSRNFKSSSKASCLLLSTLAQKFLFPNLQIKPSQMGWCPLTRKAHAWWIRQCLRADLSPPGRSENWTELLMPLACGVINPWINKRGRWDFGLFSSQSSLPAGSWKKTTAAFPFCMESNGFCGLWDHQEDWAPEEDQGNVWASGCPKLLSCGEPDTLCSWMTLMAPAGSSYVCLLQEVKQACPGDLPRRLGRGGGDCCCF